MEEDLRGQGTKKFSIFDVASQIILQMTPNEFLGINFFSPWSRNPTPFQIHDRKR